MLKKYAAFVCRSSVVTGLLLTLSIVYAASSYFIWSDLYKIEPGRYYTTFLGRISDSERLKFDEFSSRWSIEIGSSVVNMDGVILSSQHCQEMTVALEYAYTQPLLARYIYLNELNHMDVKSESIYCRKRYLDILGGSLGLGNAISLDVIKGNADGDLCVRGEKLGLMCLSMEKRGANEG
ncbi:TPA: hypothetical protein ACGUU3_004230 [Vibrio vulnificus]